MNTESKIVAEAFETHQEYNLSETLTTEVTKSPGESAFSLDQKLNGEPTNLGVEQVQNHIM